MASKKKSKGQIPLEVLVNRYHKLGRVITKRGSAAAKATRPKKGGKK